MNTKGLKIRSTEEIINKAQLSATDKMTEQEYATLLANTAANMTDIHPDYGILAARIAMEELHKELAQTTFKEHIDKLYNHEINGVKSTRISKSTYDFIMSHADELEEIIDYSRDFDGWDYSAYCMIVKSNLYEIDNKPAETITQMHLRVACGIANNIEDVKAIYDALSKREISVSSPVISNAGSEQNQMASCYLQYCEDAMVGDDYPITGKVGGIMKAMTQLAAQSKGRGGNAITITDVRGNGSPIRKVNGKSNGILPFMKMFDSTIGAVNQGGKRAGTCAVYIEPWHSDILEFLDAGNHFTIEEKRCKNLFFGLWMNDLFFKRLITDQNNAKWTLFDPGIVTQYLEKPLSEYYGDEFVEKYEYLESLNIGNEIPLMEIWTRVCHLWQTTGMPYMVNKDEVNKKSNENNLGTVKQSNLCTEITLVSDKDHTGVCVLASIVLPQYVNDTVDTDKLIQAARIATRITDRIIDLQFYPTPETRNACVNRRPVGIGMQGLADMFHKLKLEFTGEEAQRLNKIVYEALYLGCVMESIELAKVYGAYKGYEGSLASQGKLQYDLWGLTEEDLHFKEEWKQVKQDLEKYGLRNSEITALAPTAASSVRMGNAEMHEPYTRNVYVRSHIAGTSQIVNKYLVKELQELGLWSSAMFDKIVYLEGSIQDIEEIPQDIKDRYKTIYEIDWKKLIDMNADRSPFISQTSSFNHYTSSKDASPTLFTQKVLYAWRKGLKTLSYYMHTEAASTAKKEMAGTRETNSVEGCGDACQI
jgi:ribonucleoside-diphosphate reductase alpha chain